MNALISFIDKLNEVVGRVVSWCTVLLALLIVGDVLRRTIFKTASVWIMELQWHLFALVFLLGAGFALKHDRHVRVDLFYHRFSKKDQATVNFFGTLFLLLPWVLVMMYFGFFYALESWQLNEGSPDPGGLPARYLIKFAIPAGLGLLLLQAVAELLRAWQGMREQ